MTVHLESEIREGMLHHEGQKWQKLKEGVAKSGTVVYNP